VSATPLAVRLLVCFCRDDVTVFLQCFSSVSPKAEYCFGYSAAVFDFFFFVFPSFSFSQVLNYGFLDVISKAVFGLILMSGASTGYEAI
jgi:hypothetical protein